MNMRRVLLAPWMGVSVLARWALGLVMALGLVATVVLAAIPAAHDSMDSLVLVPILPVVCWWIFLLPNLLGPTWSARQLVLPGIQRDATISLILYAVATTVLPACLLAALGGSWLVAWQCLALAAGIAFAYVTLPSWMGIVLPLSPLLAAQLPPSWLPQGLTDPRFTIAAWQGIAALALIALWRWRQLQHLPEKPRSNLSRPLIVAGNRQLLIMLQHDPDALTNNEAFKVDPAIMLRHRPDRLQREADLSGTGPGHALRSLRVALGGGYLPQTWRSRWRGLQRTLAGLVFLALILVAEGFLFGWNHSWDRFLAHHGFASTAWFIGTLVVMGYVWNRLSYLDHLWRRPNAQIATLALLPHLSATPQQARRMLLHAVCRRPLLAAIICEVVMLATAWAVHLPAEGAINLAVMPAIWMLALLVGTWAILGNPTPAMRFVGYWLVGALLLVLTILGLLLAIALNSLRDGPSFTTPFHLLQLGWLVAMAALLVLGAGGLHRCSARPHPFMHNLA
ncbi:MAG TPA: hypothetical protein VF271_05940 [Rhodanobacteraceae bacterium]